MITPGESARIPCGGFDTAEKAAEQCLKESSRSFTSSNGLKVRVNYKGSGTLDEAFLEYLTKSDLNEITS